MSDKSKETPNQPPSGPGSFSVWSSVPPEFAEPNKFRRLGNGILIQLESPSHLSTYLDQLEDDVARLTRELVARESEIMHLKRKGR